jgi:O-antigen/teichoic acid export membrane protein
MYGAWLATGNIVGLLGLFDGGMNLVYSQKLSNSFSNKDFNKFGKILASGIFITILMISSLIVVGLIISPFAAKWANANVQDYHDLKIAFMIAVIGAASGLVYQNLSAIIASWLDAGVNGLINFISMILAITAIFAALYSGFGVVSIPIGGLTRGVIGSILAVLYIVKKFLKHRLPKVRLETRETKELIRDTIPMAVSRIGNVLVNQSQYLIISNFINPNITAIYALTVRTFNTAGSFIAPISSSLFSSVAYFDLTKELAKIKQVLQRVLLLQGAFSALLLSSVLSLNYAFISLWVGTDKYGGNLLSLLTFIALFISYRYSFVSTFLLGLGIIKKNAIAGIVEMFLRLLLIFITIKYLGILSLPIAQIFSTIIILIIFYSKFLQKDLKMKIAESFTSLMTGIHFTLILVPLSLVVLYYNNLILSWSWFILAALAVFTLYSSIILIISKKVREEFLLLLTAFKKKLIYARS